MILKFECNINKNNASIILKNLDYVSLYAYICSVHLLSGHQ